MRLTTSEIAGAVDGEQIGADVPVDGARHDSREVAGGELFVPVPGARDGHDFVAGAHRSGAAAHLTARLETAEHGPAVRVEDPVAALARLGAAMRLRIDGPVVGITGSVGKTTTKDLLAGVLAERYRTSAAVRSFNNEIGVPLTILNAPDDTEALVLEMGARGIGHIAMLAAVGRPTVGVVTSVSMVHTELFGDLDAVARGKGELVESLPDDGCAVLNADDPRVAAMASRTAATVVTFGRSGAVRAEAVAIGRDLRPRFRLASDWGAAEVHLAVRGEHNVANGLAAAAVGLVLGVEAEAVADALGRAAPSPWRMELLQTPSGAFVVNDCYNAGPASVEAALRALEHLPARRRLAVLGPMAELGDAGPAAHRAIADAAGAAGVELLAVDAPDYAGEGVRHVPDVGAALDALGSLGPDDAVLVKGSRVAGLERLAELLGATAPTGRA